eukprot:scaffold9.g3236.t1
MQRGLASAQQNITIASLYIGTEEGREAEFVDALAAAAHDAGRPALRLSVLLDALRSTRPTRGPGGRATSTAELLAARLLAGQPSAEEYGDGRDEGQSRVQVSLFHTPALRVLLKQVLPPRVREVVGVSHAKLYLFDDDVLISGANISNAYLEGRQDRHGARCSFLAPLHRVVPAATVCAVTPSHVRFAVLSLCAAFQQIAVPAPCRCRRYVLIRSAPHLVAFLRDAVHRISALSYQLRPPGSASGSAGASRRARLRAWLGRRRPSHLLGAGGSVAFGLGPCPAGVDPTRHAWLFTRQLRESMLELFVPSASWQAMTDVAVLEAEQAQLAEHASWRADCSTSQSPAWTDALGGWRREGPLPSRHLPPWHQQQQQQQQQQPQCAAADTWILPVVQAGFAGLRQEERCTLALLELAAAQPGSLLQARGMHVDLLTSSPEANGFFGSKGVSGLIPLAYSTLEHRTWLRLTGQRRGLLPMRLDRTPLGGGGGSASGSSSSSGADCAAPGVRRLLEYMRPGYEFHAKGMWLTPPFAAHPCATVVGSSNHGMRSQFRDLEIGFVLLTADPGLQEQMAAEWAGLAAHAECVAAGTAAGAPPAACLLAPGRRASAVGRAAVRLLRGFL